MACSCDRGASSWWGRHNGESAPHKGPVAEHRDLLNLAGSVECRRMVSFLSACCRGEAVLTHNRLTGNKKDHIIGHSREDLVDIASLGRLHPGRHQLPNLLFIIVH